MSNLQAGIFEFSFLFIWIFHFFHSYHLSMFYYMWRFQWFDDILGKKHDKNIYTDNEFIIIFKSIKIRTNSHQVNYYWFGSCRGYYSHWIVLENSPKSCLLCFTNSFCILKENRHSIHNLVKTSDSVILRATHRSPSQTSSSAFLLLPGDGQGSASRPGLAADTLRLESCTTQPPPHMAPEPGQVLFGSQ